MAETKIHTVAQPRLEAALWIGSSWQYDDGPLLENLVSSLIRDGRRRHMAVFSSGSWALSARLLQGASQPACVEEHNAAPPVQGKVDSQHVISAPKFGNGVITLGQSLQFNPVTQLIRRASILSFQQIVETFLWAFLAQDFFALWIPRIFRSLSRGSIPYDPKQDPATQTMSGLQRWVKTKTEQIKRLNLVNGWEETKRELATGPMMLIVPTLFFMWARRTMGKRAIELSYGSFRDLHQTFARQLRKSGVGQKAFDKVTKAEIKTAVTQTLSNLFDYGSHQAHLHGKPLNLGAWIPPGEQAAIKQELSQWAQDWTHAVYQNERHTDRSLSQALKPLDERLQKIVLTFNRRTMQNHETWHSIDYVPMRRFNKDTQKYDVVMKDINPVIADLRRWADYALEIGKPKQNTWWGSVLDTTGQVAERLNAKGLANRLYEAQKRHQWQVTGPLIDNADQLYTKLVGRKFGLEVVLATMMTWYLYHLTRWTQSSDAYEANRLIRDYKLGHAAPSQDASLQPESLGGPAAGDTVSRPVTVLEPLPEVTQALHQANAGAHKALAEWRSLVLPPAAPQAWSPRPSSIPANALPAFVPTHLAPYPYRTQQASPLLFANPSASWLPPKQVAP
jgi:hypothetical protein